MGCHCQCLDQVVESPRFHFWCSVNSSLSTGAVIFTDILHLSVNLIFVYNILLEADCLPHEYRFDL